jgi:hypothetical protein
MDFSQNHQGSANKNLIAESAAKINPLAHFT